MADGPDLGAATTRWDEAYARLDHWLATSAAGISRLGSEAARLYPARKARDGWRVPISFGSRKLRFDILVVNGFPFQPPRLFLVDRPPHLTWPHIESDGYLCLLPNAAAVSARDPVALLKHLLAEAVQLVEVSEAEGNLGDFRAEFLSYWSADKDAPLVRSLLEPRGPSRAIVVHRTKPLYLVGEDRATLATWLDHASGRTPAKAREFDPALLLWLDQPMLPSEYPASSADIVERVRQVGLGAELDRLGADQLQRIVVMIGAPSPHGPAFAAVILKPKMPARSGFSPRPNGGIERGFRPGHAPPPVLAQRFLGSTCLAKATVERVDAGWIHGRDNDPELPRLRAAKVVFIGCGSLGGPIALGLAQAGVGSLDLIDPDVLKAANVGRHPLGTTEIGLSKAKALASRIQADYPHIGSCRATFAGWEDVAVSEPARLLEADLIVSTIGDWAPEATLNAWRQDCASCPDLLFGWTEPHAVAGHAVGLVRGEGCLACGLSDWGDPFLNVAAWPNGAGQRGEPACGVLYQPYGPVEMSHVAALVTGAAVDALLRRVAAPFHRVWVGREATLRRAGGAWSDTWVAASDGAPRGGYMEERPWQPRAGCVICAAGAG